MLHSPAEDGSPMPLYRPTLRPPRVEPRLDAATLPWRRGLLVRATNWLGDVVMTLPAIWQLRQLLPPGKRLIVLTPAKLQRLWESVPWADEVITFGSQRLTGDERQKLKAADAGAAVILPNSFGSALDIWRARVPHRVGRAGGGRSLLLDHVLPAWDRHPGQDRWHQVSEYLDVAAAFGAATDELTCPPLAPLLTDDEAAAARQWEAWPEPWLVLAPGAAFGPAKQWPAPSFAQVGKRWQATTGGTVIAVGAPGEEAAAAAALQDIPFSQNLAGRTSLTQVMHLLARSACIVANDSGTMHLGAALQRRGVAIFGSTDPIATGPIGGDWIILRHPLPCSPCLQRTCARTDFPYECLQAVTPDLVWTGIQQLTSAT